MVAGQVGEDRGGERDAVDPVQRQRVGRHLHRAGAAVAIDHLAQQRLHLRRFRRGPGRFADLGADAIFDGTENSAANGGSLEHRGDQIGCRRLPVRAGDADHPHLAAGVAIEGAGEHRQRQTRIADHRPRHVQIIRRRFLGHNRRRAALDCLPDERRAVGVLTLEGNEDLAGYDRPRVIGHAGDEIEGRRCARRLVGADEAASPQRAVQVSPGHGRLAPTV